MSNAIWKYTLTPDCTLKMPVGAEVLTVQVQDGELRLWALVNPNVVRVDRRFVVYGTGHDIKTSEFDQRYIGTVQMNNGYLVLHVFEEDL